jgi:GGDEF domain-containing protein
MRSFNRVNLLLYMAGSLALMGLYEYKALGLEPERLLPLLVLQALYGAGVAMFVASDYKRRMARALTRVRRQVQARMPKFDPNASFSGDYFLQRLQQECDRSMRYKLPLTLLVLRFKLQGGAAGTEQLSTSVAVDVLTHVSAALRKEDVLGRLDGLDYGVYLPHTGREGAAVVAQRLLDAMEQYAPKAGAGVLGEDGTTSQMLLMAALRDADRQYRRDEVSSAWNSHLLDEEVA